MSRVEDMLNEVTRSPVKFMEFTRAYSKDPSAIIFFFEGEDLKYYGIRIQDRANNCDWCSIECKGKKDVIELHSVILNHDIYHNANALFFVDKDFDEDGDSEFIYETPCYSVENFYVSVSCFKKILHAEFKVTEFCDEADCYHKVIDFFEKILFQFNEATLYLNAWIKSHRTLERNNGVSKLNLNNVNIQKFVKISLDKIEKLYSKDSIKNFFPEASNIDEALIEESINNFSTCSLGCQLRGKYQAEFLRIFLNKLMEDRSKETPVIFSKKGKVKLNISKTNFISVLSQYADTPDCLDKFLVEKFDLLKKNGTIH